MRASSQAIAIAIAFASAFTFDARVALSRVNLQTGEGEEPLQPVMCESCGAEVGAFDRDEVYHFYHVIPSEV